MKNEYEVFTNSVGTIYSKNGKLHMIDGPAFEWYNGHKEWWIDGKPHRINGPAVEYNNGNKSWYKEGKLHRRDGPAIEYYYGFKDNGYKEWYIEGEYIDCSSQEEFERIINLKLFW